MKAKKNRLSDEEKRNPHLFPDQEAKARKRVLEQPDNRYKPLRSDELTIENMRDTAQRHMPQHLLVPKSDPGKISTPNLSVYGSLFPVTILTETLSKTGKITYNINTAN